LIAPKYSNTQGLKREEDYWKRFNPSLSNTNKEVDEGHKGKGADTNLTTPNYI
jgi:hypothetical protein